MIYVFHNTAIGKLYYRKYVIRIDIFLQSFTINSRKENLIMNKEVDNLPSHDNHENRLPQVEIMREILSKGKITTRYMDNIFEFIVDCKKDPTILNELGVKINVIYGAFAEAAKCRNYTEINYVIDSLFEYFGGYRQDYDLIEFLKYNKIKP